MLSILDILEDTTVDGPGFRTAIYAAGCPNGCPGCHNPESWDINRGHWMSTEEILEKVLADNFADVTFSGGDPMFQPEGFPISLPAGILPRIGSAFFRRSCRSAGKEGNL